MVEVGCYKKRSMLDSTRNGTVSSLMNYDTSWVDVNKKNFYGINSKFKVLANDGRVLVRILNPLSLGGRFSKGIEFVCYVSLITITITIIIIIVFYTNKKPSSEKGSHHILNLFNIISTYIYFDILYIDINWYIIHVWTVYKIYWYIYKRFINIFYISIELKFWYIY